MKDYYEILGLGKTATEAEIKKAYRRLARKYHPDVNHHDQESEDRFKEVAKAYEVLSDQSKRQMYDRYGHAGRPGAAGGPDFGGFGGGFGFEDIFDVFFDGFGGRSGKRSATERGADLRTDMSLSFKEAAFGVDREIEIVRPFTCEACGGVGAAKGSSPSVCLVCAGQGVVTQAQATIFGNFARTSACSNCQGTGQVVTNPCKTCHGEGLTAKKEKVSVKVPAGVPDNTRLKVTGYGAAGRRGGAVGDLYVDIAVKPDKMFKRSGNDVVVSVPISFSSAALGAEITVPTLDGEEKLTVPSGTQSGTVFNLRGKGIPYLNRRGRGDQLIEAIVKTPTALDEEQRRLFERLAELGGEDGQGHAGLIGKIKEAFGK